jgi:hypothetical protein
VGGDVLCICVDERWVSGSSSWDVEWSWYRSKGLRSEGVMANNLASWVARCVKFERRWKESNGVQYHS